MILLLLMFLMSCKEDMTSPSKEEIVGVYMGDYFDGVETFTLNKDGTFSQEFKKKGVLAYRSQGKWRIDNDSGITFKPLMRPARAGDGIDGLPEKRLTGDGFWHRQPIRIMFSETGRYWVVKVEGAGATEDRTAIERSNE